MRMLLLTMASAQNYTWREGSRVNLCTVPYYRGRACLRLKHKTASRITLGMPMFFKQNKYRPPPAQASEDCS